MHHRIPDRLTFFFRHPRARLVIPNYMDFCVRWRVRLFAAWHTEHERTLVLFGLTRVTAFGSDLEQCQMLTPFG